MEKLFADSENLDRIGVSTGDLHKVFSAIEEAGMQPIAEAATWRFPESAGAPRVPKRRANLLGGPVDLVAPQCIPPLDSEEYRRLSRIRDMMVAGLAREFPEVKLWMVGDELDFPYFDCRGVPLEPDDAVPFIADSLNGIGSAIKSVHPDAVVLAHYLGSREDPISLGSKQLQPKELIAQVEEEISRRGIRQRDLFEDWVSVLDPTLLEDRVPAPLPFADMGSITLSTGWQSPYFAEDFDYPDTSSLANSSSLWELWQSDLINRNTSAAVDDELGLVEFTSSQQFSSEGDRTEAGVDVVPDEYFAGAGGTYWEDSLWTAVHDFNPDDATSEPDGHAVVFIRVRNHGTTDQTRFGAIAMRGTGDCNYWCPSTADPCAAAQFTFETGSGGFETRMVCFHLSEDPFAEGNSSTYRVQIQEKRGRTMWNGFQPRWKAQVWRSGSSTVLGSTGWTGAETLTQNYDALIPELSGSRTGFGFGPSHHGVRLLSEFTGTTWWVY